VFEIGQKVQLTAREIDDSHDWLQEGTFGEIQDINVQTQIDGTLYYLLDVIWDADYHDEYTNWWVDSRCVVAYKVRKWSAKTRVKRKILSLYLRHTKGTLPKCKTPSVFRRTT
jgi:hypothetical protein